jgi:hypothetical protein
MAESYESFFYKLQEENYGQLADIVRRLTLLYPLKKLWVTEATYGILVKL